MKTRLLLIALMAWQAITAQTVTIQVDANLGKKNISPYIYGKNNNISDDPNSPTSAKQWNMMRDAGLRFTRENGGNNATKYNWRLKLSSHPDWYNNVYAHDWDFAAKSLIDSMPNTQGMWAFQLIGKAAKTKNKNFDDWSYNKAQWWAGTCQNLAGGGSPNTTGGCVAQTSGDPSQYLEAWTADSTAGILDHWFGTGGLNYPKNNIRYWSMDNEPEIWNGTHDDIMPTMPNAEDFMQSYFAVAKKARAKFPDIKLCGPVPANEWQWYNWDNSTISVGGKSYVWLEYFIKRCAEEQKATGIKLVDVIDIHNYPDEGNSSDIVQLHRLYFDSTYAYPGANGVKKSGSSGWDNSLNKEYILGRCKKWLNQYMGANHDVTVGISEYGIKHINANVTSVNYASILGTFADNEVEYFSPWSWHEGMWETMHLFSRYARASRVQSTSSNEQDLSAYSSINALGDSMTVILVNRSLSNSINTKINLSNFPVSNGAYKTYQLSQLPTSETFVSHTNNALKTGTATAASNSITISLPALSTTAIIINKNLATGINDEPNMDESIQVYPNPSVGVFKLLHPSVSAGQVEAFDPLGKKVHQVSFNSNQASEINLSQLANGLYVLRISTDKGIVSKKIEIKK